MKNLLLTILFSASNLFAQNCMISGNTQMDLNQVSTFSVQLDNDANYFWSTTGSIQINGNNNSNTISVIRNDSGPGKLCITVFKKGAEPCCNCIDILPIGEDPTDPIDPINCSFLFKPFACFENGSDYIDIETFFWPNNSNNLPVLGSIEFVNNHPNLISYVDIPQNVFLMGPNSSLNLTRTVRVHFFPNSVTNYQSLFLSLQFKLTLETNEKTPRKTECMTDKYPVRGCNNGGYYKFNISPNPTKGEFDIQKLGENDIDEIIVYDMNGNKVFAQKNIILPMKILIGKKGIFMIKGFLKGEDVYTSKIVIE